MDTLGPFLKAHREKRGIRLEEIASITKIHLHSLELLEAGDWTNLPPEPFIRGFITAYAKYVGLDAKEIIHRYLEEVKPAGMELNPPTEVKHVNVQRQPIPQKTAASPKANAPKPSDVIENKHQVSFKQVGVAAASAGALLLILIVGYVGKRSSQPAETVAQSTAETTPPEASSGGIPPADTTPPAVTAPENVAAAAAPAEDREVASNAKPTASPTPAAEEAKKLDHEITIESKDRTWIKVVVDEEAPIEYFLPSNEHATYKAQKKIKVVLGNSTGSKVTHNGEVVPGTKFQGTIRSYIFPENARFPQDIPKKQPASDTAVQPPQGENAAAVPIERTEN